MTFAADQNRGGDEPREASRPEPETIRRVKSISGLVPASASLLWRGRRYWLAGVLVALVGVYLASGFFVVEADERAVVRRFGAVAAQAGPGMHYRLPWPVDRVDVVKTTSVMKVGVGFATSIRWIGSPDRHRAPHRRQQHPQRRPRSAIRHSRSSGIPVQHRGCPGFRRGGRRGGAHRNGPWYAGRRGTHQGPGRSAGTGQGQDPGDLGPPPQRHCHRVGEHHDHDAGPVGGQGLPGRRRRHG